MAKFLSFACFCVIVALTGLALGIWQLQRLEEKQAFLQKLKTEQVSLTGTFSSEPKDNFWLSARNRNNEIQHRLLRILKTQDKAILVDTGWVSSALRANTELKTESLQISGTPITPEKKGFFMPENQPNKNQWYYINLTEMAESSDKSLQNYYISTDQTLWQKIPNNHLQYAITWFCLGAIFLIMPALARKHFQ